MKFLISAGGSGGKLWPISADENPKQFSQILDHKSLFRHNLEILLEKYPVTDIYISTKKQFSHFITEQASEIPSENVIYEPDFKRDTGPGTLYPILILSILFPEEPFTLVQSACYREPRKTFLNMLGAMEEMVVKYNQPITGGIRPEYPDMGSDYLKVGERGRAEVIHGVKFNKSDAFVWRTGDLAKTKKLIRENDVFVHCNHLCWYPTEIIKQVKRYKPEWATQLAEIKARLVAAPREEITTVNIDDLFEKMELGRLEDVTSHFFNNNGLVVEVKYNWQHIASWSSIFEALNKDGDHNVTEGKIQSFDSNNNLLMQKSGDKKVVVIGMEEIIFVETEDSILICDMKNVADVKKYTENL